MSEHRVLILGAGNAGISLASRLLRQGEIAVHIADPKRTHIYRPLLNYAAGGQAKRSRFSKPMRSVIPRDATWHRSEAVAIDPEDRFVHFADGGRLKYDTLVIAAGLVPQADGIEGLEGALDAGWAATAHLTDRAEQLWRTISATRSGTAVFSVPPEPAPCGGTALKPLFLAADYWRAEGVLPDIEINLVTPYRGILDIPSVEEELRRAVEEFGIAVHHDSRVVAVNNDSRSVTVAGPPGEKRFTDVAAASIVPPYRAPAFVGPLSSGHPQGLVDVDPETLQHRTHPAIWSLGDIANLQTRPSGGALRRQVEVLAANISGQPDQADLQRYDGYTIVPVTVDRRRVLLAEFNRDLRPQPTTRLIDLTKPRRSLWVFDRYLEPHIYFRALLKGHV